jgi:hypothetical protein
VTTETARARGRVAGAKSLDDFKVGDRAGGRCLTLGCTPLADRSDEVERVAKKLH